MYFIMRGLSGSKMSSFPNRTVGTIVLLSLKILCFSDFLEILKVPMRSCHFYDSNGAAFVLIDGNIAERFGCALGVVKAKHF